MIVKEAFLKYLNVGIIMFVARSVSVSLFLNLVRFSFFSVSDISTFFPSSYFLSAIMPSFRGLRYYASSEVKSDAYVMEWVPLP